MAPLKIVATDGTKITAAASRTKIYNQERLDRELAAVDKLLEEAEAADEREDRNDSSDDSSQLPEHLKDAKERKARLKEIADSLNEINRKNYVATDPECRVMRTTRGNRPAYNLQASVDEENQIIVAMKLTQDETDYGKLPEMSKEVEANTGRLPDVSLADAGYCDESTLRWISSLDKEVLMPIREQHLEAKRNDMFASKCFVAHPERDVLICPAGRELTFRVEHFCNGGYYRQYAANDCQSCSHYSQCVRTGKGSKRINISTVADERKRMKEKLKSEEGKALFKKRCSTVEPVFGQSKWNRGFERFRCWGLKAVKAESALIALAHNIGKWLTSPEFLVNLASFWHILDLFTDLADQLFVDIPRLYICPTLNSSLKRLRLMIF
jgi:hypothetical protein